MSVQANQYFMWAIRLPFGWSKEWEANRVKSFPKAVNPKVDFYDHFQDFIEDSAFEDRVKRKDGIFCIYDGMNGKWIFIGRVLAKSKDGEMIGDPPITIPSLTDVDKEFISQSVIRHFGIGGEEFKFWLVTKYR